MSIELRIMIGIGVIICLLFIIKMIKKGRLNLKYSLLWLLLCVFFLALVLFPSCINWMQSVGFASPVNGLLTLGVLFCLMLVMTLSVIVSQQTTRIKNLAQYIALLEKRIRDEEKENDDGNCQ